MTLPLLKYFGWVESFLVAALLAASWCFSAPIAQAETEPQGQKPTAVESHDRAEAFAEMGRETVEDCLQPACLADRNPESDASLKRQASFRLGVQGRRRPSPPPIRFTSCQEKVDAFAHKTGRLLSKMFCVLPHQSSHQHGEQNEVHENLRGGEASLDAERPL
jgi:hypothetical protein